MMGFLLDYADSAGSAGASGIMRYYKIGRAHV
jgi:hypothetical protein